MKPRWWVSWYEPARSADRLFKRPKPPGVLGAWESGARASDRAGRDPGWTPGGRFPS